jgi:dephospho-CoA kinase
MPELRLPSFPRRRGVLLVGLTGGIASGQSSVGRMLAGLGAHVVEADALSRELTRSGRSGWWAVRRAFGKNILLPSGEIDRGRLAALVFRDARARRRLERILHPLILAEEARLLRRWFRKGGRGLFVAVAALMFEAGSAALYDVTICVHASERERLRRLMRRDGLSRAEALARLRAQMPLRRKRALADFTVPNSSSLDDLRGRVLDLHRRLMEALQADERRHA